MTQRANALDDDLHPVPDLHRSDPRRRTHQYQITGQQRHHMAEVAYHLFDRKDHVAGITLRLAHLTIDLEFDVDRVRVEIGLDPGAGRTKGVE